MAHTPARWVVSRRMGEFGLLDLTMDVQRDDKGIHPNAYQTLCHGLTRLLDSRNNLNFTHIGF